ncbi:MAG: glycoside hydrolase family 3 N-terminal domain-containing protein [Anaerolineae bacterium]
MKPRERRHGIVLLLLLVLATVVPPIRAQETPADPVLELMAQMSPEAKVGQLVLVTYPGTDLGGESEIIDLIREYRVGGLLLRPASGNFGTSGIEASDLISITNRFQLVMAEASTPMPVPPSEAVAAEEASPYVPLLIGLQASDAGLSPFSLIRGTSDVPTPMAIGATWDPSLAEATGAVLGAELAALGVNLYLGPDLDVLGTPRPGDPADLGTRVFGGDPFWVGELGTAYIEGLHKGSGGQLMVAPRHLPGLGGADRPLEDEIPTVQKPLEQLKQVELVPFFAAAKEPLGSDPTADAFLVTHIKYAGFQGNNIRRTTRPISLDATALQLVANLTEVAPWREAGGVLVADNLGLSSVHRSYDPRSLSFNARRVTQDALSAGNDLLILDSFSANGSWEGHFANIRDTLDFLASRYRDQPAFQAIVDSAVHRILSMKLRIYPEFELDAVLRDEEAAEEILGQGAMVSSDVALKALTRIFPLSEDLMPPPPQEGESIVVFTQERQVEVEEGTQPVTPLTADTIPDTLMRFYGPDGTGVVRFNAVRGFTFEDLSLFLDEIGSEAPVEEPSPVALSVSGALRNATWIVFATRELRTDDPSTMVLKRYLASQADLSDARIVVLAFGPPYQLDQTEMGKLTVFYALYSTGEAFVEAGVRALFQAVVAPGASPVDVPSLNYFLARKTMPDKDQTISLFVVNEAGEELTPTQKSNIHVGDVINLRTGVIVDGNGHVVPDGTPVQFVLSYPQEGSRNNVVAETVDGIASTAVTLDRVGQLDITAHSEPAVSSVRLELIIRDDGITITEIEPTATPTPTPTLTPTPTPTPTVTPTSPAPSKLGQLPDPPKLPIPDRGRLIRWGLLGSVVISAFAFLWSRERAVSAHLSATLSLTSLVGSLGGYVLIMAFARWWLPVMRYGLVDREYAAGLAAAVAGALVFSVSSWVVRDTTRAQAEDGRPRVPGERYSRSQP